MVHRDHDVEALHVFRRQLSSSSREFDSVLAGDHAGSGVGWLAHVPGSGAGRVDVEALGESGLSDEMMEDPLGERRSADVAEADEENRRAKGVGIVRVHRPSARLVGRSLEPRGCLVHSAAKLFEHYAVGKEFRSRT